MRRHTSALFAAVVAGALVLTGCGSDDPPAAPGSPGEGASSAADVSAPASDAAGTESAGSDAAGSESGAAGSESGAADGMSSEVTSADLGSESNGSEAAASDGSESDGAGSDGAGADGAAAGSASAGSEESSDAGGSDTSGGSAGTEESAVAPADFDEQTTGWFAGMCEGFAGMMMDRPTIDASGDFETQRAAAVEYYNQIASGASSTADKLDAMPPPTIEGGEGFATGFSAALRRAADEASKQAPLVEKATDAASLEKAVDTAEDSLEKALGELGPEMQAVVTAPGVEEAMKEIPACKPLVNK